MNTKTKAPEIGKFPDPEEKELVESLETGVDLFKSGLTPKRRREIESMARMAMTDERAKISLSVSKRDLVRLKSRALQEGVSYQTLINALDSSVRLGIGEDPMSACLLRTVALLRDLPEHGLVRGQVGTIVESLDEATALVEFSDDHGRAYAIAPCPCEALLAVRTAPLAA